MRSRLDQHVRLRAGRAYFRLKWGRHSLTPGENDDVIIYQKVEIPICSLEEVET